MRIVAPLRRNEFSSAPLQSLSVSARYYLRSCGLELPLVPYPDGSVPRRPRLKLWAVPILLTRDANVVGSAASVAVVVAAVCCPLRRKEFRIGDAVDAV